MKRKIILSLFFISLIGFELFNFASTEYAVKDLIGDLAILGIPWSLLLAVAFCSVDLAGIVTIFTPEKGKDEPMEVVFIWLVWLTAATFNATLTWWAMLERMSQLSFGNSIISHEEVLVYAPIVLASIVWMVRVALIGTISLFGENILNINFNVSKKIDTSGMFSKFKKQPQKVEYQSVENKNRRKEYGQK